MFFNKKKHNFAAVIPNNLRAGDQILIGADIWEVVDNQDVYNPTKIELVWKGLYLEGNRLK